MGTPFTSYSWPESDKVVAPAREPGRLVTWSEYRPYGGQYHAGLLAWIGGIRIGRIDVDDEMGRWYLALPQDADADEENPWAACGVGGVEACKVAIEKAAEAWIGTAGLTINAVLVVNDDAIEDELRREGL